jgi:hypothetical protein
MAELTVILKCEEDRLLDDRKVRLQDLGLSVGDRIEYVYDFGDNWRQVLALEDALVPAAEAVYPRCGDGQFSSPPEDVGGVSGYEQFLEALSDPDHEEHEDMKAWVGRPFDSMSFSAAEANERLRKRLQLGNRQS